MDDKIEYILDDHHQLLETPMPKYSNLTMQRAFLVWCYSGQQEEFRTVCNFYHHLETFENSLPEDQRKLSRACEFDLINKSRPKSQFVENFYPSLYSPPKGENPHKIKPVPVKKDHRDKPDGPFASEIVAVSRMILQYCYNHKKSHEQFLLDFHDFADKCKLGRNVTTISLYLKKMKIKEEIELHKSFFNNLNEITRFLATDNFDEVMMKKYRAAEISNGKKSPDLTPKCVYDRKNCEIDSNEIIKIWGSNNKHCVKDAVLVNMIWANSANSDYSQKKGKINMNQEFENKYKLENLTVSVNDDVKMKDDKKCFKNKMSGKNKNKKLKQNLCCNMNILCQENENNMIIR